MTEIHAKPIIENKFWIVEENGTKVATLRKNEDNRFVMSNELGIEVFDTKESLTRKFGNLTAVDNLTLSVDAGEVFGLLGPNGAGKSTLFQLLSGLFAADGGRSTLRGLLGISLEGKTYPDRILVMGTPFDYPLSSRFDENDAIFVFDNVLIPWENVLFYRHTRAALFIRATLHRYSAFAFVQRNLKVADATAISLCRDNKLPIVVFNLLVEGNIARAVQGEAIGTLVSTP